MVLAPVAHDDLQPRQLTATDGAEVDESLLVAKQWYGSLQHERLLSLEGRQVGQIRVQMNRLPGLKDPRGVDHLMPICEFHTWNG